MTAGALTARLSETGWGSASGRIQLGTRQARSDVANFRDHGRMVDRPLLRLLSRLQKMPGGYALVSECSLRAMIHQDTGHLPGVGTIPKALRRMEERLGCVESRWIHKGSTRPDGIMAMVGCLRVRAVFDRNERRLVKRKARTVDRRVDAGQGDVETFRALRRAVSASVASSPPEELSDEEREREYRAKVARSLAWLARATEPPS